MNLEALGGIFSITFLIILGCIGLYYSKKQEGLYKKVFHSDK